MSMSIYLAMQTLLYYVGCFVIAYREIGLRLIDKIRKLEITLFYFKFD